MVLVLVAIADPIPRRELAANLRSAHLDLLELNFRVLQDLLELAVGQRNLGRLMVGEPIKTESGSEKKYE
jgi:hypothetical protein